MGIPREYPYLISNCRGNPWGVPIFSSKLQLDSVGIPKGNDRPRDSQALQKGIHRDPEEPLGIPRESL